LKRPKAKLGGAAGAAVEARVAGSGYEATATALGPAMRALSTLPGLGFAHFGALAGVGKGRRVSAACKCFTKFRIWLIIKTTSHAHSFPNPHLPTSVGSADLCAGPSVLKVTVLAAAAELLRLAGESLGGVILLSGYG
jgi:hypothetical protein